MRTFDYICMVIAFMMAGLSLMMFWGQGLAAWIWQVTTMIWVFNCYMKQRTIERIENDINNLKNKK